MLALVKDTAHLQATWTCVCRLGAQRIHLRENGCGFTFELITLPNEILFRVLAGAKLEIQVTQIVVNDFLTLAKIVQASLFYSMGRASLWPENVGKAAEGEERRWEYNRQVHDAWLAPGRKSLRSIEVIVYPLLGLNPAEQVQYVRCDS